MMESKAQVIGICLHLVLSVVVAFLIIHGYYLIECVTHFTENPIIEGESLFLRLLGCALVSPWWIFTDRIFILYLLVAVFGFTLLETFLKLRRNKS
jgi:hypothetical protein